MLFEKIFQESEVILTEGALVERLKAEFSVQLDGHLNHAGLIYENPAILETLYRQYIDIGRQKQLPIMLMTPTRKVNIESVQQSKFKGQDVLVDSCAFLRKIKSSYTGYTEQIMIGGLLGCKGDAYSGQQIFSKEEAYGFHKQQTVQFQNQNIDYLFAGIMPEINESIGMAKAMAETKIPYIISFMMTKSGCLMDGTSLIDAISLIDEQVAPKPICYMANCIHPTNLIQALNASRRGQETQLKRFRGIQANASILSPEELNNCTVLHQDDFDKMIDEMHFLYEQFDLKIFGGCCGTNNVFMESLSEKMSP